MKVKAKVKVKVKVKAKVEVKLKVKAKVTVGRLRGGGSAADRARAFASRAVKSLSRTERLTRCNG